MKIALAQQNYHVGNFESNTEKIIKGIKDAEQSGADLVVFSELCICGYPPRDFVEFNDFINKCYECIDVIKGHTNNIGVIVGSPQRNPQAGGKDLFNAAILLYQNEIKGIAHKSLLPTYDVFDEYRYFEPGTVFNVIEFKGKKIALTICEDLWNLADNPLYVSCPMDTLIQQAPDLMINISASPFDYDHDEDRKEVVRANVLKYRLPMFYCNAVGSQTEVVFDGGSLVFNAAGKLVNEMKYFEEDFLIVELTDEMLRVTPDSAPSIPLEKILHTSSSQDPITVVGDMRVSRLKDPNKIIEYLTDENNLKQIHRALILGIRDYFSKMGFSKAILGSSGGVDSAVVLTLACEALGAENVRAILMPSQYSSGHSVSDAEQLSKNLNNPYDIIPIAAVYDSFLTSLKPILKTFLSDWPKKIFKVEVGVIC